MIMKSIFIKNTLAALTLAGAVQVGFAQTINLDLNESFEISIGDSLEFEFQDQGCGAGYQGVWLNFPENAGKIEYQLVYMNDCGWGAWAPNGRKGNNIYYGSGRYDEYKSDPVFRSNGWHTGKITITKTEISQEVDGKVIFRSNRDSITDYKGVWALSETTKQAKVVNHRPVAGIRPSSVRNIKLIKGESQPEPTGGLTCIIHQKRFSAT